MDQMVGPQCYWAHSSECVLLIIKYTINLLSPPPLPPTTPPTCHIYNVWYDFPNHILTHTHFAFWLYINGTKFTQFLVPFVHVELVRV